MVSTAATENGQVGKTLGLRLYLHSDTISAVSAQIQDLIDQARTFSGIRHDEFNVVRVNAYASQVSFLLYPNFFEDAFPTLDSTFSVDLARGSKSKRSYRDSLNPPILHRKETLLPPEHPHRPTFEQR